MTFFLGFLFGIITTLPWAVIILTVLIYDKGGEE